MSMDDSSILKTMALGRPFQLGLLYDSKTEKLFPGTTLWSSALMKNCLQTHSSPSNACEIHIEDTFWKKADLLGIETNLQMSVLTGLVEVFRSAELIHNRKETQRKRRFILKYSVTTCRRELTMTNLSKSNATDQEIFNQNIATHVVIGILYGAEVYFIFDRPLFHNEDLAKVDNVSMKLLEKLTTLRTSDNGQLNLDDDEQRVAQSLTCSYYGDFHLHFNPITFQEAAWLFKQLPKLLGPNQENTVPKQIWMYPLHLLDKSSSIDKRVVQINHDLVLKSIKLIEKIHQLEMTVNDLKNSLLPTIFFHQTDQQLSLFCVHIQEFEIALKKQMRKLLPEIRSGIQEETALVNLLENIDLFALNEKKVNCWIQSITKVVKILTGFFNKLDQRVNIDISSFSLLQSQNNLNYEFILRMNMHLIEKNDLFLNEMFTCLSANNYQQNNRNTKSRFNQNNFATIRKRIALFLEFAQVNRNKQNVKFIAEQQYADDFEMKKDVTVILYQKGVPENFEIPSRPGQPRATNISLQGVTLTWSAPTDGSRSIQQYKIYGQSNTSAVWTLLLRTKDAVCLAWISNIPIGKYQFKVKGITIVGDTAESDISVVIDTLEITPTLPDPTPEIVTPLPNVTANQITAEKAVLDVLPAWFEPVKSVDPEKVRLPLNYNENSPVDVRTYKCLSAYRSMKKKTEEIDFVEEPFRSSVQNTETLIVVLNELAHLLGASLTFSQTDFKYIDSDYRTACGITNLSSIHSLVASEGNFETAKFQLHMKLDYDQIATSPETLKKFVLTIINDIATIAQCNKDFIRVFSVSRAASVVLEIGITTPQRTKTEQVADSLKHKFNSISPVERRDMLQHLILESYDYKLEPALAYLQLQISDFEPRYNNDYPYAGKDKRGGYPYYYPQGWFRHALRVIDKYPDDQTWLSMKNVPGEWAVAYHGTNWTVAKDIKDKGLLHDFFKRDAMKGEATRISPSIPDVKGIYLATHATGGASIYATSFDVKDSTGRNKSYQVVFQCRVQPGKFTEHSGGVNVGKTYRVFDEKAIRPYGLLLKSS